MSFIQRINVKLDSYKGLLPQYESYCWELEEHSAMPKTDWGETMDFKAAEISLLYLEFHKVFELHDIMLQQSYVHDDCVELTWDALEQVIDQFRLVIDKMDNGERKDYLDEIARKLSDLYRYRTSIDKDIWQIEYWTEYGMTK